MLPALGAFPPRAAVVETVFTLPLMLLFVWGIFEYSRYVMMLQVVNNAAREACRYAVMHTNPVVLDGSLTAMPTPT